MKLKKLTAVGICFAVALSCFACTSNTSSKKDDDDDDDEGGWYMDILNSSESSAIPTETATESSAPTTTEATTTTMASSAATTAELDSVVINEISTKLTDLSYAMYYIDEFEQNGYDMTNMLFCARTCLKLAPNGMPTYVGGFESYDATEVNNFLVEYFGISPDESYLESLGEPSDETGGEEPFYDGNSIYFFAADGELAFTVAIVDSYETEPTGEIEVDFTLYDIDYMVAMDLSREDMYNYCYLTGSEAAQNRDLIYRSSGEAEVILTNSGVQFTEIDFNNAD